MIIEQTEQSQKTNWSSAGGGAIHCSGGMSDKEFKLLKAILENKDIPLTNDGPHTYLLPLYVKMKKMDRDGETFYKRENHPQ